MSRRFCVLAGVLAAFLSILLVHRQLSAQEAPAQEAPAQETPAQETPAQQAPAQESPAQADPAPPAAEQGVAKEAAPDPQQARAAFEAKLTEWKEVLKQLRTLKHDYQLADEAGRAKLEQQWTATVAQANGLLPAVAEAAIECVSGGAQ